MDNKKQHLYLQSTAPLPPQFRQPGGLSFPSSANAFAELLIKAAVEHKHVRHNRREIETWDPYCQKIASVSYTLLNLKAININCTTLYTNIRNIN